jgi:hypothetical protein
MCAVAAIPYIIAIAGTAYGMYKENQASQYQQGVARQQKKLADQNAINANAEGSYAADQARIRGNLQRGQQLAAFAANNVDFSTGSAADILGDTAMFTAQDERQARINASLKAYGFQVQGLEAQAAGKYARWNGRASQFGTFLQGASQVAGMASSGGGSPSTPSGGGTLMTSGSYTGSGSLSTGWAGQSRSGW